MTEDSADHPSSENLASYIDGTLNDDGRTKIEAHLADCAECREILAASADALKHLAASG